MPQETHRSQWRMPPDLFKKLDEAAKANGRSANAELVKRLQSTFIDANEAAPDLDADNNRMLRALCEHLGVG